MSDHWRETSPGDVADIVMGQYPPIPSLPALSLKGEGELEGFGTLPPLMALRGLV